MPTVNVHRPRAVVDAPRPNLALVAFCEKIEQKLTNNSNLPNAGGVLADLTTARLTYSAALSSKGTKKEVADACTAARQGVIYALHHAKDHVNGVAEKASPDQAKAIIESSGFRSRKVVVRTILPIDAKFGGVSGSVLIVAAGVEGSAIFYFQLSTDQKSWTACPNVLKCKALVTGLTVGAIYYFRVQVQTRKGLGDWSPVVSFVVR